LVIELGRIIEDESLRDKTRIFADREDAGRKVAELLLSKGKYENPVVCAIPSGGVPIGLEIARELSCPLEVAVVRKIQIPWNPEAGFGAVTWDGRVFVDQNLVSRLNLPDDAVASAVEKARTNVQERLQRFAGGRPPSNLEGKTVFVADDGLATGSTMFAAVEAIRARSPARVIVAIPTGPVSSVAFLAQEVDEVICPNIRGGLSFAVAEAYTQWRDLSEDEVIESLRMAQEMGLFGIPA
jgi:putative phosphoribosyl transferase